MLIIAIQSFSYNEELQFRNIIRFATNECKRFDSLPEVCFIGRRVAPTNGRCDARGRDDDSPPEAGFSSPTEQTSLVAIGKTPPAGMFVPHPWGVGTKSGIIRVRDGVALLVDEDLQGQKNPIEVPARTPPGPIDE